MPEQRLQTSMNHLQVTHVAPPEHGDVVGQQLQRNDGEDPLQAVHAVGDLQELEGHRLSLLVALLADQHGTPTSSGHLRKETRL